MIGLGWWKYDTKAAAALLEKNGFTQKGGKWYKPNGERFKITLQNQGPDRPILQRLTTTIAEMWTNFGIETTAVYSADDGANRGLGNFDGYVFWSIETWGGHPDMSYFRGVLGTGFLKYGAQRVGQCALVIFIGITVTFFIPRLAPTNPIDMKIQLMTVGPMRVFPAAVAAFRQAMYDMYGLKGNIAEQYISFWGRFFRGDLGPSITTYPRPVGELIGRAMPWTIGLLLTTSILSWLLGNLLGGLAGYYSGKRWTKWVEVTANCLRPIPYYMFAFVLLIVFCYLVRIFPSSDAYDRGLKEGLNLGFIVSVLYRTFLPALSLVLVGVGGWLLGMRALVSNIVS